MSQATTPLKIAVFGLGYVGIVTAVCLAYKGHEIVGVDVNPLKLSMIRDGRSPIIEPHLAEMLQEVVAAGRFRVTESPDEAVLETQLSFVCVGTPSDDYGGLDLRYVRQVAREIGRTLRRQPDYHLVVFRSTMLPGTITGELIPLLEEESGKLASHDFGVCGNPEFLREGSSIHDFDNPPFTVIGEIDARSGELLDSLYRDFLDTPIIRTDLQTGEMVKYACNVWHAMKITFANEIGNFCKQHSIDSHKVMEIFCLDTKLNISTAYLKPGFAFGGSCLPKDLRALLHRAQSMHLALPVLEAARSSNQNQVNRGVEMILRTNKRRLGILGLSFKEHTDDLRESPLVSLVEKLIGKGFDLLIYDVDVSLSWLIGANRRYIEKTIPHIASLIRDSLEEVIDHAEVLVVGKRYPQLEELLSSLDKHKTVIDLVRIFKEPPHLKCEYHGICW